MSRNAFEHWIEQKRREAQLRRFDQWAQSMFRDHPVWFNVLILFAAATFAALAMALSWLLGSLEQPVNSRF